MSVRRSPLQERRTAHDSPAKGPVEPNANALKCSDAAQQFCSPAPPQATKEQLNANAKPVEHSKVSMPAKETVVQTGIDRYITVKRKISPQKGNADKIAKTNKEDPLSRNKFAVLSVEVDAPIPVVPKMKPPPIYLREQSNNALVKSLSDLIGKGNFHIVPISKGNIKETKIQIYSEAHYRTATSHLSTQKRNYYTYQLKSSKGLSVVLKGIEASVDPNEIKEALEENNFAVRSVINIFNRNKVPQPMFKVELMPNTTKLKKNETHPIYALQYLLHRKITVEEPHKRNGPVQCINCQEYGHTKTYCTLRTVCVVCGDLHHLSQCTSSKSDVNVKKCSNCGGNHTANYRGCPVYKDLKNKQQQNTLKQKPSYANVVTTSSISTVPTVAPRYVSSNVSYASILKNNAETKSQDPPRNNEGLESMILTLTQCMTQFMTTMQNMMQDFMRTQTQMFQTLLSKK